MTISPQAVAVAVDELLREVLLHPPRAGTTLREQGLDSMAATRLWLELQARFGAELPLEWLGTAADAEQLVVRVASMQRAGDPAKVPQIATDAEHRHAPFPLTPMQEAYVLGSDPDLTTDPAGCHQYLELTVGEDVDVERLRRAWHRLVEQHDALRLTIDPDGRQRVRPDAPETVIVVHDLIARDDREAVVAAVRQRLSDKRYAQGEWPLFTIEASRVPSGTVIHLSIDLLVTDGHGLALLLDQWSACYEDAEHVLPNSGVSLRDSVLALRGRSQTADHARDLEYWDLALRDLPPPPSTKNAESAGGPLRRRSLHGTLAASEWHGLRARAAAWNISPSALVLTVFSDVLARREHGRSMALVVTTNLRAWLPPAAEYAVGPFTSSTVVRSNETVAPLQERATSFQQQLWDAMKHSSVCGVTALRRLRSRDRGRGAVALPVVFTSLLGVGPRGRQDGGFGERVTYALCRTADVALEHQMHERRDELHYRWDFTPDRFPPGAAETSFAAFENMLRLLLGGDDALTIRPLNDLQQAYYVARVSAASAEWNGCQIYESFEAVELDTAALERRLGAMMERHEALRSFVTADGRLAVRGAAPRGWRIPLIDVERTEDLASLRDEMAGKAFPLAAWPPFDVRVTRCEGRFVVHCSFDLAVVDARGIHRLCRELFADPTAAPSPETSAAEINAETDAENEVADLPSGPSIPASDDRCRIRLQAELHGWHRIREIAARHEASPDSLLLAVFLDVIGGHWNERPFAVPVVRFAPSADVGEHTTLSWVAHPRNGSLTERAAAYERLLVAGRSKRAGGLQALRRRVMRERGRGEFAFPVVYTSVIDLSDVPLPSNVRAADWLSCTPDVSLDCIGLVDGETLFICWDAVAAEFAPGRLAQMFQSYRDRVAMLIDRGERAGELSYDCNGTVREIATDRLPHQLFEQRVAERPDAMALRGRGWMRTYAELNAEANRIARQLRAAGVGTETVVGVSIRRGPAMIAACLGIVKAGGAYLPVEPSLPAARAATLLEEGRASLLVTTTDSVAWEAPPGIRVLYADRLASDGDATNLLDVRGYADSLAYVIFTSGSTGKPKGVAVEHRALLNLLQWCSRTFRFGPRDVGLGVTSLGFDLSVFDIFGLLGTGATLYVADETERLDPELLVGIMLREGITFWNSAPAALAQLAPLLREVRGDSRTSSLRLVFSSGDFMPLSLPGDVRQAFPNATIVNLGGATEATVWSNWFEVEHVDPSWRSIPYGRPIDNARYYVLDEQLEPCGAGVEGDLYIGGACLSRGYFGRPELSAERFIADPLSREPGQRLYRTGDRAAYLADGNLTFLGRADRQVKIRGFRIEPAEVEHRLRRHEAVKDVVVEPRTDSSGDRKLVAYVIAAEPRRPAAKELRAFVAEALPDYMVPLIAYIDCFPATVNGKLDRDALPWPLPESDGAVAGGAADLQEEIATLFAELLGVTRFDPAHDMWYQGATSFTVVQASNALHARYGRRIPISAVLADPTVAGIARWLAEELGRGTQPAAAAADDEPPAVDYFSEEERRLFREGRWNARPLSASEPLVPLDSVPVAPEYYAWRSSRRDFLAGPVGRESFSRLLALLRNVTLGGRARRLYPSAGDTFAVQLYLHVRANGVEAVEPGLYYYRAEEHALQCVNAAPSIAREVHFHRNRPLFDAASFELYLIGQTKGIEPLYRENAQRYLDLEAGHMSQLLMTGQAACGIGLCPIGDLQFDVVGKQFGLDGGHRFLMAMLGGRAEYATRTGATPPFAADAADIAITGLAGRYPGAEDPDALWQRLIGNEAAIAAVPAGRRSPSNTGRAGYLDDIDGFDSRLFRIAPAEAETLDPQLRLLLETVWACLENAGHTPASLRRTAGRVGVIVGAMWQDYQQTAAEAWQRGGEAIVSAAGSDISNRISQVFDFRGPSLAVDAACTSSVAALHLATEMLRRNECGAVVVGAVNLLAHPYHLALLSGLGLTAQNVSGAFDANASGWVPGEGVAAVLLRRAHDALADRDVVHGVIEATTVGHFGRSGAIDADDLAGAITRSLAERRLSPEDITYVECAAAGASVADAAEIDALAKVFGRTNFPVHFGTLKANVGHLEAAAGLSQLTKVLLQLRHQTIAPARVAEQRNPLVPWSTLPLRLADRASAWPERGAPRRALINSVAANGAYGHVIVRAAAPRPSRVRHANGEHVIPLSAATPPQLVEVARRLRVHLASTPEDPGDVAWTLQSGRTEQPHRVALPCRDLPELLRRLDDFIAGRPLDVPLIAPAAAWVRGETVEWPADPDARRISLPHYPFARRSEWVGAAASDDLEEGLLRLYAEVSGIARLELDPHVALEQYGLSSLLVTRMNARLERELGPVPATLFYEHRTLAEIAGRLRRADLPQPPDVAVPRVAQTDGDIAIIGIAGRYPRARTLDELWSNLAAGRDCITALPADRRQEGWPADLMWGGYLDDVASFDALLFNITPRDADLMDPQERLFLETVWEALDDAGYPRQRLRDRHRSRAGVWAGSMYNEYPFFGVEQSLRGTPVATGAGLADIANRVSHFFDLRGPSMTVDTLCSSSLTCIHLAVESLRRGECEVAIAGGVNLSLHPNKFIEQARHEMRSSDHRCRSFGAGGDGFVPGEGVGVVVLKPLAAAKADGDRVHAIIKGTAVNHAGRTSGYMVPSPEAQAELIGAALASARVAPETISAIEAHGTGTELGDPIEIAGLEHAFAGATPPDGGWAIGSVKSSIGHLEAAAGIAGLTKVVLQLRERMLAPSLHADELNPNVDWSRSPFRVQRTLAPWRGSVPLRAGISSFGAGGANAHVIVEELVPAGAAEIRADVPQLIVLSARDAERLRELAASLDEFLARHAPHLEDVAYTLQVGREALRERLAFVAADLASMRSTLRRFCAGESVVTRGRARPSAPAGDSCDLETLAQAWVDGAAVEWTRLHDGSRPRIVALPSYPFERRRHWVPSPVANRPIALPLYRRTWAPCDAEPVPGPLHGSILCTLTDASEPIAMRVAAALGPERVLLVREGAPADDTVLRASAWLDLCDVDRGDEDAEPWLDRLALVQRFVALHRSSRVLHVTRGLQNAGGTAPGLAGARVAGLVRMLHAEYPNLAATTLDLDRSDPAAAARIILAELHRRDGVEIAYRGGRRHRPDLTPAELPEREPHLDDERVYVVTGATGGLGTLVVRHLAARGARRLALLSHRQAARELVDELARAGVRVETYRGSLTARADLEAFLARARGMGAIGGIVHCAGAMPDDRRPFGQRDLAASRAIFEPKIDGLEILARLCAHDTPSFFVLFSSLAGTLPALAAGAADYAVANAFMDRFAAHHAHRGRPELRSIAWPSWRGAGSAFPEPPAYARLGLEGLEVADGLRLLDAVIGESAGGVLLVCPGRDAASQPSTLLESASRAAPSAGQPDVPRWLTEIFANALGASAADLAPDVPFDDLGIGSVLLIELLQKIEVHVGRPLQPALLLENPTLAALSKALGEHSRIAIPAAASAKRDDQRVAIIGMSCRFPGAPDLDAFWTNLRAGHCAVGEVPVSRWSRSLYRATREPGTTISRWGGFVEAIEEFDPEYFRMSEEEALCLDPAVRLVLEGVETCLADAGYQARELAGRAVGAFAGARVSDYWRRAGTRGGAAAFGSDQNFIAARVAHHLDVTGPCFVIDSACSSSLVAVQLAVRSLLEEESEIAFAAGVDVLLDERPYLEFSAARALSPTGRCRVFDESADGFVPGEGCGVLLLKRLDRALRDGDRIYAVIESVAVNNDGRTVGLTTPNPAAQTAVILRAIEKSGVRAEDIAMIEAHGTGTMLGDPIELRALTDAFRKFTRRTGICGAGSVKSNLGHLLSAAGMAGLIKAALSLEHGEIPPTLFCDKPNPRFDFARSPLYPNVTLQPWPGGRVVRAAGVSAFGLGGTNAHLIATAFAPPTIPVRSPLPPPRFRRRRLWLDREPRTADLHNVAELVSSIADLEFVS